MRLPCLLCDDDGLVTNCVLLDISPSGAKVKLDKELPRGEGADLGKARRLIIASLVNFPAVVVWQDGLFVGFRFLSDEKESTEAIIRLLPQCVPGDDVETDAA